MEQRYRKEVKQVRQGGAIYDAGDLKLALLDLNEHGFDLHVKALDSHRLHLTCKKTHNRFVIEFLGHNKWPDHPTVS